MRLLNALTLQLEIFPERETPIYAILSHTWSKEEVSFQDLAVDVERSNNGWQKILSCCKQALEDGFSYLWVDTCCIDKTSSAELSEAINSMFRWYSASDICYVHLADIKEASETMRSIDYDKNSFTRSRWFTRSWTLQELIAPIQVVFFDAAWEKLDTRDNLADKIAGATGIDAAVLRQTSSFRDYSVAQRFSWAADRQATRFEDKAYSLLGLFDVNMPLLYGEGTGAFARLQEEIMKVTTDLSLLAWSNPSSLQYGFPLASSLQDFARCDTIIAEKDASVSYDVNESGVSAIGFRMTVPVVDMRALKLGKGFAAILNCRHANDITTVIALKLSHVSRSELTTIPSGGGTFSCTIGWPGEPPQDRVVLIDVLEAANSGQVANVLIRQSQPSTSSLSERPRDFTYLWVRFRDHATNKAWLTETLYPKEYWTHQNRTFDLARARLDNIERDKDTARASRQTRFGLPIHGAIALSHPSGEQVAIYFSQDSLSLQDGLRFELGHYDPQDFEPLSQIFFDGTDDHVQRLRLRNGLTFRVELRAEQISSHMIAHLAVSLEQARPTLPRADESKEESPAPKARRRRNPFSSKKFHSSSTSSLPTQATEEKQSV